MAEFDFKVPGSGGSGGGGKKSPLKKLGSKPMLIGIIAVAVIALFLKSRGSSGSISEDPFAGYPTMGGSGGSNGVDLQTFESTIKQLREDSEESSKSMYEDFMEQNYLMQESWGLQNEAMRESFTQQLGSVTDTFSSKMENMSNSFTQQFQSSQAYQQSQFDSLNSIIGNLSRQNQVYQPSYGGGSLGGGNPGGSYYDSSPSSFSSEDSYYRPNNYAPSEDYYTSQNQAGYRDQMDSYLYEQNTSRQSLINDSIQSGNWNAYNEFEAYHQPQNYYRDEQTGNVEHTQQYWNDMIKRREGMINELVSEGKKNDPYTQLMITDLEDTKRLRDAAKK